jgi:hypothetical protein
VNNLSEIIFSLVITANRDYKPTIKLGDIK